MLELNFLLPNKAKQSIVCLGETLKLDKWRTIKKFLFSILFIVDTECLKAAERNKSGLLKTKIHIKRKRFGSIFMHDSQANNLKFIQLLLHGLSLPVKSCKLFLTHQSKGQNRKPKSMSWEMSNIWHGSSWSTDVNNHKNKRYPGEKGGNVLEI